MLESQSDSSASPARSGLEFRAPLFRVQRGLRIDFSTQRPSRDQEGGGPSKAVLALTMGYRFLQAVDQAELQDFAAVARTLNVSRAWVSMRVELTFLAPKIQEAILLGTSRLPSIQELVHIAMLRNWGDQLDRLNGLGHGSKFLSETWGQ